MNSWSLFAESLEGKYLGEFSRCVLNGDWEKASFS
jgi:hypothetical protein